MTSILGLGDNTIDTYVDAGVQYPGGNAVNVAAMTARLGASAGYLGCVGDDEGGQLLRYSLAAEGVDLSRVRTRSGANARAYIGHVDGDRRFIRSFPGVRGDYRWQHADFDYIKQFDHVHTSVYSDLGDDFLRVSEATQSFSFDASDKWTTDLLRKIVPHIRFIFLSASHVSAAEAAAVASECLALGAEAVILTRGGEGAIGFDADGQVLHPALPTSVADTLGAGDGFISGFLTAALVAAPLATALNRGASFAAQVCSWQGGFGHGAPWVGKARSSKAS